MRRFILLQKKKLKRRKGFFRTASPNGSRSRACSIFRIDGGEGDSELYAAVGQVDGDGGEAIHQACAKPGSLVLAAAPSRRQSGEFLNKVEKLMRRGGMAVKGDGYNELSVLFANGSRIVGLPGVEGTVRGFSEVSLLVIDEASRVDEAMYQALRPMLAVGEGHLWLMSTPNFKSGFFYDTWEHGGPDWFRVSGGGYFPAGVSVRVSGQRDGGVRPGVAGRGCGR